VRQNGSPIDQVRVKNAVSAHITYSPLLEQWFAAKDAGLDLERWQAGGYERFFMAQVVAAYRLQQQISAHQDDAAIEKSKRDRKRRS
jgi:alkylated DNA repair dioxygenase AlkB